MGQHLRMQLAQLSAGFHTEFLDQGFPGPAIGRQRISLPLRAIQGQDEKVPQALPQRVLVYQCLELRDAFAGPAQIKVGGDPILERDEPQFLQTA